MKRICKWGGIALIWVGAFFLLQALLVPKYMDGIPDGALVREYYRETTEHDVIFIGDCEVYENFSPVTLWENYGITSYVRGSPQQLIWHSYYTLKDTLERETPQAVVFNVLSMQYSEPQSEAYNRMALDDLPLSVNKIQAVLASKMEDETLLSYIFPLFRYHSRWSELTASDFRYLFYQDTLSHNGFLMRADVRPVTTIPEPKKLANYQFADVCYEYLDKIRLLCEEEGVELILIKAPSLYPHWYEEWDRQMVDYAGEHGLTYINFLDRIDEIGLDFSTDTYDQGLHLNLSGAEKLSDYFGAILRDAGIPDRREDEALSAVWAEKCEAYHAQAEAQYAELAEKGYLTRATTPGSQIPAGE